MPYQVVDIGNLVITSANATVTNVFNNIDDANNLTIYSPNTTSTGGSYDEAKLRSAW